MAQAAVESSVHSDLLIGKSGLATKMKRMTPSELRGEQLKRRTCENPVNNQLPASVVFDRRSNGLQSPEQQKVSKYINTRVTEVFPVKKSRNLGKENCKDVLHVKAASLGEASMASKIFHNSGSSSLSCVDSVKVSSVPLPTEAAKQGFRKVERYSENALCSVSQLHKGDEKLPDSNKFDMEKALKRLGACGASASSMLTLPNGQVDDTWKSSEMCHTEITIPGKRVPLDFTLKTTLQFVSSSSVKWCHKLNTSYGRNNISEFIAWSCHHACQNLGYMRPERNSEFLFSKALQSWVYPQSVLPSSIVSAMASSTVRGDSEFLLKRQQDWENSFQNLYYMLRKNFLNVFYVYTTQFVVLFIGANNLGKKQSCNAYLSQSTHGLRSLLRKHDVCFSMPLCHTEVEEATEDDLVELSEIQKCNLGQALHLDALSDVDNTTQSLLSFIGNESVHGLYDFLLNYRSLLNSLSAMDVPVIYSPVPFQNGCLHVPEVRCKEIRKANDFPSSSGSEAETANIFGSSAGNICYSIEIKDTVVPPWTVSGICAAMSLDGRSFDLIFATEPSSMGLNVAFNSIHNQAQSKTPSSEGCESLGIPDAVLVPSLHSASLRRLRYMDGKYVAYTTV